MGFVGDQRGAVALADLDELLERRDVAVRAVEGVDGDQAGAMLRQHAVEGLRVVVSKQHGLCPGADHALVQRNVRLHVEIDRAAARCERLDQPNVGGVPRRADDAVFGLHQGGDALFEVARDVRLVMHPDA